MQSCLVASLASLNKKDIFPQMFFPTSHKVLEYLELAANMIRLVLDVFVILSLVLNITTRQSRNIERDLSFSSTPTWFTTSAETIPIQRPLVEYPKIPYQLQGLLAKAYGGRPLTMITIGGSNSAGGGVKKANQMFYNLFTDWWNKNIFKMTGSKLTSHKMAIGGTGSDFFSFCLQNMLPPEQPDIVLVELSVNDYGYKYGEAAKPMELLTRRLLSLPSKPLVLMVHFLYRGETENNESKNPDCLNMEDLGFTQLAEYYGIPSFSVRDAVCPLTKSGTRGKMPLNSTMFSSDGIHANSKANAFIASMIIEYFNSTFAALKSSSPENIGEALKDYESKMPVNPLFLDSSVSSLGLLHTLCLSFLTPNWKIQHRQTLYSNFSIAWGFNFVSFNESKQSSMWHTPIREDAYGGWLGKSGERHLQIQFLIPAKEDPQNNTNSSSVPSSRSVAVIYRMMDTNASFEMWLDHEWNSSVKINTRQCGHKWTQTRLYPLATTVSPGYHTLHVAARKGGWFQVSGIVVGQEGFHGYQGYRPFDVKTKVWSLDMYQQWKCY